MSNVDITKASSACAVRAWIKSHELLSSRMRSVSFCEGKRSRSACRIRSCFGTIHDGALDSAACEIGVCEEERYPCSLVSRRLPSCGLSAKWPEIMKSRNSRPYCRTMKGKESCRATDLRLMMSLTHKG